MTVEGIPIKQLWSFLSWLPGFVLRRKFKPEVMAGLIYIDVRPRFNSVTINIGGAASYDIWLQVINLSPFVVELDRAEFEIWCGPVLKASILKRQKLMPGEITSLRIFGSITDGEAMQIARNYTDEMQLGISGHIDFNCKLHSFGRKIEHLGGISPRILNLNLREELN